MNKEYSSPEIEIISLQLGDILANSYDEHLHSSGNIENPDSGMEEVEEELP